MKRWLVAAALVAGACSTGGHSGAPHVSPAPTTTPTVTPSASPSATPTPSASKSTPTPTPTHPGPPGWLAGDVVDRLPTSRHVVALTFDGGSGAQGAQRIVATLVAEGVPATFFVTGDFAAANRSLVASLVTDGFVVGNHTVSHPHINQLDEAAAAREVTEAATTIEAITHISTEPWFRFPFGEYNRDTLRLVHSLGYGAIGWTIDSRGWQGRSAGTAADLVQRVRAGLQPGAIVLMHLGANPQDGTTYDADALPAVISAIRGAGYGFEALTP